MIRCLVSKLTLVGFFLKRGLRKIFYVLKEKVSTCQEKGFRFVRCINLQVKLTNRTADGNLRFRNLIFCANKRHDLFSSYLPCLCFWHTVKCNFNRKNVFLRLYSYYRESSGVRIYTNLVSLIFGGKCRKVIVWLSRPPS